MIFVGRVYSRSSDKGFRSDEEPPSESVLQQLNPQREKLIVEEMGWQRLKPGSLNLCVDKGTVDSLKGMKARIFEHHCKIEYPWKKDIPKLRGGYNYYSATATANGKTQEVLVRMGAKNPLKNCLELFAPVHLRNYFGVVDEDEIEITVTTRIPSISKSDNTSKSYSGESPDSSSTQHISPYAGTAKPVGRSVIHSPGMLQLGSSFRKSWKPPSVWQLRTCPTPTSATSRRM